MSSRVGTAIPASRSTALSSAPVGFTRSIQTALSGSAVRSPTPAFFRENSEGTNTDNIEDSGTGREKPTQQDLARFWQALMTPALTKPAPLWRLDGNRVALIRRPVHACPKICRKQQHLRQKRHNRHPAARQRHLRSGIL